MIGVHRLEGFYWVARTGGYASAARAFPYPISQPGVHQQVKKLEEELGLALFENAGRNKLLLTPAGKRLFEFVEPFYGGLPVVLRSLRSDDLAGELRIGAPSLYLQHLLPSWLKRIQDAHPDIRVVALETQWGDVEALTRGDVDVLVEYLPAVPDGLASQRVATVYPFLVLPREHARAADPEPNPAELAGETFVAYLPGHLRDLQDGGLETLGLQPPRILTASTGESILGFVAAGLGYSLLGGLGEAGPQHPGVVTRRLREPPAEYPVWMLWRKETPENRMLDAALECAPEA